MIYDKFQAETEIKDSRRPLPTTLNSERAQSLEPDTKSRQCPKTGRVLAEFSVRSSPFLRSDLVPIRSHSCPECRKNFATSSGLKQHQHIHKSIKPFQCKVCLKAYTQFSNLCRHKRMHADCRQQIKCLGCGQAFSTLISLNKHKRFCDADHGGVIRRIRNTSDQFGHPPPPPMPVYRSHLSSIAGDRDPVTYSYPLPMTLPQPGIGTWNVYRPQLPHQISSHLWFPGPSSPSSSSASATTVPIFQRSSFGLVNAYETFQRLLDPRLFSPTYDRPQNEDANRPGYDVRLPEVSGTLSQERVCREMHQETNNASENTCGNRDRVNSERYESPDRSASNLSTSPRSSRSGFRAWRETSPAPENRDRERISRLETKESSFLSSSPCQTVAKIINREEPRPLDLTTSHKSFARFDPGEKKRTEDIMKTPTSFPSIESLATSAELRVSTKPVLYLGLPGVGRLENLHGSSNRDLYLGRPRIDRYGDVSPLPNTSRAAVFDEGRFLDPSYPQLLSDNHCRFDHDHLSFIGHRNETGHISISKHPNVYHGNHSLSNFSPALVSPLASISDLLSFKPAKPRDRYTCRYCGKVFPRSANLTRHLRTHTGEQPYKCQYCRRCFSISSNLQRHVRNIHNKEKPFRCPLCERCFGQQTNLDRHTKKHESTESICSVSTECPTGIFNHPHQLDSAFPRRDQFFQDHNGFLRNPSLPQTTPRETDSWQVPGTGRSAKVDSGVESTDGNSSPTRWREMDEWRRTDRRCADGGRTSVDSESESIDVVDTSSESNVDNDAIGNDDISTCIYGSDHDEASDDDDVIIDVTECPVTP